MKNRFFSVGIFIAAILLVSGCSSEETPSELENLINQLQTSQITSETVPEETSEDAAASGDEDEKTEALTTPDNADEPSNDTNVTENNEETTDNVSAPDDTEETTENISTPDDTEETTEDISTPDNTEETTDISEENSDNPITYDSMTVKVLSVDEDIISVESGGTVYNISINKDTPVLGGTVLEGKVVTITYIVNDDGAQADITVAVITVLPDD